MRGGYRQKNGESNYYKKLYPGVVTGSTPG